jgi:hypothetical protein
MYLGTRRVRSAGRTSGSVEMTLPVQLSMLQGVMCRLVMRDGARPELVLEPELGEAQSFFRDMWEKLALGLAKVDEIGDFSAAAFELTLFSSAHASERPPLTYVDGLAALRERVVVGVGGAGTPELDAAREALARVLGALGAAAAQRLGLAHALALAFGDAVAYVMTGVPAGWGTEYERAVAHRAFRDEIAAAAWSNSGRPSFAPFEDSAWRAAQLGLARVFEQHRIWQAEPAYYQAARDRWHVALTLEMRGAAAATTGTETWRFSSP